MATASFLPDYVCWKSFKAPFFCLYLLLHLSVFLAPFTFTWQALSLALLLNFLSLCLGITLCYHRLLAHRSYQLVRPLRYVLCFLACLAWQRGPLWWVSTHRLHHARTDKPGDPHSPQNSALWAHLLWPAFKHPEMDAGADTFKQWTPDLYADPGIRFLESFYPWINAVFLIALFALGYLYQGLPMAMSFLVWAGFMRILYVLHSTWLVNSACHLWGKRRFNTPDTSRNNPWVAFLTFGEGWHNNHHAHARSAQMGLGWREPDVTYWVICLLERLGLASKVVRLKQEQLKA